MCRLKVSVIETVKGLDAAWRRKVLCVAAMYAVLFLLFALNRLLMTDFSFAPSVCDARLLAIVFVILIFKYCKYFTIPLDDTFDENNKREERLYLCRVFAICTITLGAYYIVYFPGGFGSDCGNQLSQAMTKAYNDWHPAIHTLLFYTVPLALFHHVEAIVPLQILWFSLAFTRLMWSMRKAGCPLYVRAIMMAAVCLSPMTGKIFCQPYKDCGLAIFATLLVASYVDIVNSNGKCLEHIKHIILFAVSMALASMMRHNAILFTLPLAGAAVVFARKRRKAAVLAAGAAFVIMAGIKWPLYRLLNVKHRKTPVVELTGMCMSIMGRAVSTESEKLDGKVTEFLYQVAPKDAWQTYYKADKGFNSIKWLKETDISVVEKAGITQVLKYTLLTIRTNKMTALKEFLWRVRFFYSVDGNVPRDISTPSVYDKTKVKISPLLTRPIKGILTLWTILCKHTALKWLFYLYIGIADALCIVFVIIRIYRDGNFWPLLHALPLLCHNAGTSLLLTGNDIRYFYFTLPVVIPMLFLILRQEMEGGKQ